MALGKHLEKRYGKDSMLMLVDEGSGLEERYGQVRLECFLTLRELKNVDCDLDDCRACDSREGVLGCRAVHRDSRRSFQCPSYVPYPCVRSRTATNHLSQHLTPASVS